MAEQLDQTGASACHSMIAGIAALKIITGAPGVVLKDAEDDGNRHDYASADRLIGEALDRHSANPGFRRSLANFLLTVYASDVPDMAKWTPLEMLTDDGYRGQAAEAGASAERFMPDSERVCLALQALWEIESLARAVCLRSDELEASDLWIRGIVVRLRDLASVGMTALDDDTRHAFTEAEQLLRPWETHTQTD